MENWTQVAAGLSLALSLVVVMAMSFVMNAVARRAERRAQEVYLQAKGLAFSLARSQLQGLEAGLDRRCPSCHGGVDVMVTAGDCAMSARVVDVSCGCGLCACRLGMNRPGYGAGEDQLI